MKYSECVMMMNFLTFCYEREYAAKHGRNPPIDMVENYVKWRFEQYCEANGIEYIFEN